MLLHHRRVSARGAEPERWLLMLHGILGRGENLAGLAKGWCAREPGWGVVLADLRMHGDSQRFAPPHTLAAATADVAALLAALPEVRAVAGHSFGGKVALGLLQAPPPGLEHVFVLDASPAARAERDPDELLCKVLASLRGLPARFADHASFGAHLSERGVPRALVLWLAKNLVREPDGLRFGLDVEALDAMLADYDRVELWSLVQAPPPSVALHFVVAGRSAVLAEPERARLQALADRGVLTLDLLPEAGHWLHVDDPDGVLDALGRRLG